MISKTVPVIKRYLREMGYDNPSRMDDWLFINHMGGQFTRQGVSYLIINKNHGKTIAVVCLNKEGSRIRCQALCYSKRIISRR